MASRNPIRSRKSAEPSESFEPIRSSGSTTGASAIDPPLALFGRESEMGILGDLIDRVSERGAALLVRGDAGIGKSALLAAATERARARGFQVLTAAGVQCETHLPFAGLHQLLLPVLADADRLPPPQRRAVDAAFGVVEGPAPELFLIALASLHLLSDAAARAPILLVAEDAQWLDRPTVDVLTFVARRLEADPIVLLVAIRDGYESPFDTVGIQKMRLDRLDEASAAALLDTNSPGLHPAVRTRLLEEAEGNALALVELPMTLRANDLAATMHPALLPLTTRLERAFSARASELSDATRAALLVAAADDRGLVSEVLAATSIVAGPEHGDAVLTPAVEAGLVRLEIPHLRFHHPLVRSAIYQSATITERGAAHAALAKVLAHDPDRRAWHLAASATGPDEEVALQLDEAADRAVRRGAIAVAINGLQRAAALSPDPAAKGKRLLRAVELTTDLGRFDVASDLLSEVEAIDMQASERLRVILTREGFNDGASPDPQHARRLVELADGVSAQDVELALGLLRASAMQCWWTDPDDETRTLVVDAAARLPVDTNDPRVLAIRAIADPIRQAGRVIDQLSGIAWSDTMDPGLTRLYGQAAWTVGDMERSALFMEQSSARLREQGRLGLLVPALNFLAWARVRLGDFQRAASAADEAVRLAGETSQTMWGVSSRAAQGMIAAVRGSLDEAEAIARETETWLTSSKEATFLSLVPLMRGVAAIAAGRYGDAYDHLRRLFDPKDPTYHYQDRWRGLGYLAEAAAHSGQHESAWAVLDDLEPIAAQTPSPGVHIPLRYARAVLAGDRPVEALFNAGLAADLAHWPFERARLLLAYGAWLRRQRRLAESRTPLRSARDTFDALGAVPWGDRARQELTASGETSRKRTTGAWDQLSPQELQIAQLAAEGLSNREIGERLYLSHRTVGSHLYRIFPKLGIASRAQLHQALTGSA